MGNASPVVDRLMARVSLSSQTLPSLRPTKPFDPTLTEPIDAFAQQVAPKKPCLRAALHLLNDDIDRAHKIAQDDEGDMSSNLCHAILHRREGDYWNSKWWFRQIDHPLIKQVYGNTKEAQAFVDAVEAIVTNKKGNSTPCAANNLDKLKRKQADELLQLVTFMLEVTA